jgi:hypothetical protein
MNVLDLFAGTGSSTQAFQDRGHNVTHIENDPALCEALGIEPIDVKTLAKDPQSILGSWKPDVIWASPPCTAFTMAGKGSKDKGSERWAYADEGMEFPFYGPRFPTDETARVGCGLVLAALEVIRKLEPRYWWLENPMGGLKTMGFMEKVSGPVIVTYCQYGDTRMKPTTLWGVWPETWIPRARCYNGETCHDAAPRGSRTGTQGLKTSRERSMIPYALSLEIAEACEAAFSKS